MTIKNPLSQFESKYHKKQREMNPYIYSPYIEYSSSAMIDPKVYTGIDLSKEEMK